MAYEELSESWIVPRRGDWVTDKKGEVWRVQGDVEDQRILCIRRSASGRKSTSWKSISSLTVLDPSLAKILTSVNK